MRGPKPQQRLPWHPLQRLWEPGTFDQVIAEALGTARTNVVTMRKRGLTVWMADRYACKLGLHPACIWGDLWWELALEDVHAA